MNCEYQPTIIESRLLIERLANQLAFLHTQLQRNWRELKNDPATFARRSILALPRNLKKLLSTPHALTAGLTALVAVTCIVTVVLLIDRNGYLKKDADDLNESPVELTLLDLSTPHDSQSEASIGKDGPGRVGFQPRKGEGSGPTPKKSQGGGGGGNGNPTPAQTGKMPPPSNVLAAIPTSSAPPSAGASRCRHRYRSGALERLEGAGLWRSEIEVRSAVERSGRRRGNRNKSGTGIGEGQGPGFGPGKDGNIGDGSKAPGCCGPGGGHDEPGRTFSVSEVRTASAALTKTRTAIHGGSAEESDHRHRRTSRRLLECWRSGSDTGTTHTSIRSHRTRDRSRTADQVCSGDQKTDIRCRYTCSWNTTLICIELTGLGRRAAKYL